MLKNFSIKGKMLTAFGLVLISSVVIAAVALYAMIASSDTANTTRKLVLDEINPVFEVHRAYNKVHSWLHRVDVYPESEMIREGLEATEQLKQIIGRLPNSTFPERASKATKELSDLTTAILDTDFNTLMLAGKYDEAHKIFLSDVLDPLMASNASLSTFIYAYVDAAADAVSGLNMEGAIYTTIAITIISVILALTVSTLLHHYIVGNVQKTMKFASQLEHGDFNIELDQSTLHNDEIGRICLAFLKIAETLNRTVAKTIAISIELEKNSKTLNTSAQAVTSGAKDAENRAITIAAAADEMVSTTSDIAKSCHAAQETSEDTRVESNNGMESVRAAVMRIREQAEYSKQEAAKVLRLAEQSSRIGSIVSTIEDIAAQTNLLALNAAIEAARAGEAGRGFAVVADEVRALASRTSDSTKEIAGMVVEISADSEDATQSINQSVAQMQEVAEQAASLESNLTSITDLVDKVYTQIVQIAAAAEEQINATSEISENLQNISNIAQQSTDVANNSSAIAGYCEDLVTGLLEELNFFKLNEKMLKAEDITFRRIDTH